MTFEEFHEFLIVYSGVTNRVVGNLFDNHPKPTTSFFFQPYQSKLDPLIRASTLITGPIVMSFLALEGALISVFFAFKSIADLIRLDTVKAKDAGKSSAQMFFVTICALCVAIVNPMINLIDLICAGVNYSLQNAS